MRTVQVSFTLWAECEFQLSSAYCCSKICSSAICSKTVARMGTLEKKLNVVWQDLVQKILVRLQAKSYLQLSSC